MQAVCIVLRYSRVAMVVALSVTTEITERNLQVVSIEAVVPFDGDALVLRFASQPRCFRRVEQSARCQTITRSTLYT